MEYYEYGIDKKQCTYGLVMESCSRCLFETLCRLEHYKKEEKKSDLSDNNDK